MGAIHYHARCKVEHIRHIAEIDHEVVVTKRVSSLGEPHLLGACLHSLLVWVAHILAREELPLLDIYHLARLGRCNDKVGLTAEECRNLHHIYHLAYSFGLPRLVNIG